MSARGLSCELMTFIDINIRRRPTALRMFYFLTKNYIFQGKM